MGEIEYSEAAVEVLDILNHTNKEDVERIPQSFIKFLTDISSKSYKSNFNHEQPINRLNLRQQTKELLGFIYITWWCNEQEREKYKKVINENNIKEQGITGNYNVNDIFKNKKEHNEHAIAKNESTIETSIVKYKKESFIKKVLNRILSFFVSK